MASGGKLPRQLECSCLARGFNAVGSVNLSLEGEIYCRSVRDKGQSTTGCTMDFTRDLRYPI